MNALARYLLVFLLGWSGAVFAYKDLIYAKKNAPLNGTLNEQGLLFDEETGKPPVKTQDVSSNKEPKLPTTASGMSVQNGNGSEQPKP